MNPFFATIGFSRFGLALDAKAVATNQTFIHATLRDCLEQMSKQAAFTETTVPVV
ncbi:hypothetical protein [Roseobacter sp. OBYS 0001]|uniref:hypothetical protein n=1 Tax=Roseobacter sp. OBYS 0001 TaxID=882651 RepID=UPI001C8245B7|nr:hypothetical protein [Roseobacter sp. OBYS 0001]